MSDYFADHQNLFYTQQDAGFQKGRPILTRQAPTCKVEEYVGGLPFTNDIDSGFLRSKTLPRIFSDNVEDRFWKGEKAEIEGITEKNRTQYHNVQLLQYHQMQQMRQQQQQQQQQLYLQQQQYRYRQQNRLYQRGPGQQHHHYHHQQQQQQQQQVYFY